MRAAKDILRGLRMPFASLRRGEVVIDARRKLLMVEVVSWNGELACSHGESAKAILRGSRRNTRESDRRRGEGETRARSG
ncbi:hypothetical protein BuS5_03917 [Desulfosarcina sp. BuS5]|nr:hypothetical protein BuS5_00772 [Desulfosarcina sp. BuS5]WDN90914.1 hypothetical protein BuS5_03885 [Desulfosarcina sp. BuS5]WDN90946.1 hypothetical protein BuS5_03917 [Desulfosarcina sp. BuS5]